MYIIRNAWRSIVRSPGRTTLITLLVAIIATAAFVALSIQQSADAAKQRSTSLMEVKAHINVDRQYVMQSMQENEGSSPEESLSGLKGLTLEEMEVYAKAPMVRDFYYYGNISLNGDNGLKALNKNEYTDLQQMMGAGEGGTAGAIAGPGAGPGGGPGGPGGQMPSMQAILASVQFSGDFILYGYLSEAAMENFRNGTCRITQGRMFDGDARSYECIITEELATYNSLKVGDRISLSNPNRSSNRFQFTVAGVYKNSSDSTTTATQAYEDPANYILTSYRVLSDIVERTKTYHDPAQTASTVTLSDGQVAEQLLGTDGSLRVKGGTEADVQPPEEDIAISSTVVGTYVFSSIEDYDAFEAEVVRMGLPEKYVVTSNDVASFEASLIPLNNLSAYASTFLYIILGVGAAILIGVNFYNVRERKYEIGALTAMGMRKSRVAAQFVLELTIVTFFGIALGLGLGSLVSTPVTNELLSSQVAYEQENSDRTAQSFGRAVSDASGKPHGGDVEGEVTYVDTVTFHMDYTIVYEMALIGAALALVSSAAAMISILRYNPLAILAQRN